METKTEKFDAVGESRKWKECVAAETNGLGAQEVLTYFDRKAVNERFQIALQQARSKK